MNIVFMGTPEFALPVLKGLLSSEHSILAVVTQPDRPKGRGREVAASLVKRLARECGIEVLQPEKANRPEFIETLRGLQPDLILVVAFGQILNAELLAVPKVMCMNLHASLLPKYRGAAPINWPIINGDSETGVTTMKMDTGLDTGDILLTRKIPIEDSDTARTLHDSLAQVGADLVLETLWRLEQKTVTPVPQDASQATYARKLKKEDGWIRWRQTAREIRGWVRGLEPWPGSYTLFQEKRIRICRVEIGEGACGENPGVVARVTDHGIEMGTGEGRLIVTELQPEGKKRMSAKSFLAGHRVAKGDIFDSAPAASSTLSK